MNFKATREKNDDSIERDEFFFNSHIDFEEYLAYLLEHHDIRYSKRFDRFR